MTNAESTAGEKIHAPVGSSGVIRDLNAIKAQPLRGKGNGLVPG